MRRGGRARASWTAARYGAVLRPRGLVGLRGAGWSHDGLWYVRRVVHDLAPGSYRQAFTLARDGLRLDRPAGGPVPLMATFFGKYRGTVANNVDPMQPGPGAGRRCRRCSATAG